MKKSQNIDKAEENASLLNKRKFEILVFEKILEVINEISETIKSPQHSSEFCLL